jgi:heat shock protein HslJ
MSHTPYEERLAVYGDLDPAGREKVDRHLGECPACAARLAEYRAMQRDLRSRPSVAPDEWLREGFYAAVARAREQDRRQARQRPLWQRIRALGDAAAWVGVGVVAVALLVGLAVAGRPLMERAWPASTAIPASVPGADLVGSEWVLTVLNGEPLVEGTHITLAFGPRQASGFAGCNRYGLEYTTPREGALSVGETEKTLELCLGPEGVMEQERAYTKALRNATTYRLVADRLELANAAGDTILSYRKREPLPMDPRDLVGTEWRLVSWDGQPPIEGSIITIAFTEGEISGLAGCRGYTGTYEAEGDHIRFPRMAMTEAGKQWEECSPALQQQEGEYTTCLSWVTHYRLEGGQLELLTARGESLLYTAAQLSPPTAATPAPPLAGWVARADRVFGVTLRHPAHWKPVEGYERRYGGPDGYFDLGVLAAALSIDEVAALEASHKLQPYGSSPTIEALTVQGQEARLILPSADQPIAMERLAVLIVRYPQPVTIRGETYEYLSLYADVEHIRGLAATLEFLTSLDAGPVEG